MPLASSSTRTRPSVTSTSTASGRMRTSKAVPTARTATGPAPTTNGQAGFLATWKCASPRSSRTFRSVAVNCTATALSVLSRTTEPSGNEIRRIIPTSVDATMEN